MKWLKPILIIVLVLGAVGISGCIDSGSSSNSSKTSGFAEDLYLEQTTEPYKSGSTWEINGWITSKSGKSYDNISFIATGYTVDNEVIGTDKVFVARYDKQYQSTGFTAVFPAKSGKELDHITIQVTNATIDNS